MVATPTLCKELEAQGFTNVVDWSRGVDTELFRPRNDHALNLPRPIYLYVGRIAVEKNIEAFLRIDLSMGAKVVIGDGPQMKDLKAHYPTVHFTGAKHGEELARHFASADVLSFPPRPTPSGW